MVLILIGNKGGTTMPFVLVHKATSEIYTCKLINNYDLAYHGTKFWDFKEEAEETLGAFIAEQQLAPADWTLVEVEEEQLKMFNVKLKNDARYHLYRIENGKAVAKKED
jgi:hypothetical protein